MNEQKYLNLCFKTNRRLRSLECDNLKHLKHPMSLQRKTVLSTQQTVKNTSVVRLNKWVAAPLNGRTNCAQIANKTFGP